MGIIDTLFIALKFKVDDTPIQDIEKGAKGTAEKVGENVGKSLGKGIEHGLRSQNLKKTLVDYLPFRRKGPVDGVVGDNAPDLSGVLHDATTTLLAFGAAATGAGMGLFHMVHGAVESLDKIGDVAEITGVAARDIAVLGKVAELNDSSLEDMIGTINRVTVATGQAAAGVGRAKKIFQIFGLSAKNADGSVKSFDEMMEQVAEKVKGKSLPEARAIGSRLGISPHILKLLREGKESWKSLRSEVEKTYAFTESDFEAADRADKAYKKMQASVGALSKRLGVALIPQFEKVIKAITKWVGDAKNIEKIKGYVSAVSDGVLFLVKNIGVFAKVIGGVMTVKLGAWFLGIIPQVATLTVLFKDLSWAIKLAKSAIMGGLLVALTLAAEDIWVFLQGGNSLTGWLINEFPNGVNIVIGALGLLGSAFLAFTFKSGPLGILLAGLTGFVIAATEIQDSWNVLRQWFGEFFDELSFKIDEAIEKFSGLSGIASLLGIGQMSSREFAASSKKSLGKFSGFDNWDPGNAKDETPSWLAPKTTNIGNVHFNLPNAKDTKEGAKEAWRNINRLATGGVKG